MNALRAACAAAFLACAGLRGADETPAPPGSWDERTAASVVVVANGLQPESVALARHYADARGIPRANILALPFPVVEAITRDQYEETVLRPLRARLLEAGWLRGYERRGRDPVVTGHRIRFLVTVRGVPLRVLEDPARITGLETTRLPPPLRRNEASVDAELALLGRDEPLAGPVTNPLFQRETPVAYDLQQIVRTARLDGATWEDARSLVDAALEGERRGLAGRAYVDQGGPHAQGDAWLGEAAALLEAAAWETSVERTGATLGPEARLDVPAIYCGWYTQNAYGAFLDRRFRFPPGAVAFHLHSFSATTLRDPAQGWVAAFVARGAAATVGNTAEPYLEATHQPQLFLARLRAGWPWGDAAWFSIRVAGWQNIVVGDPLYRPFVRTLAQQFAELDALPQPAADAVAARQMLLWERAGRRDDAVAFLRARMLRAPSLATALSLAALLERAGDRAGAARELGFLAGLRDYAWDGWPLGLEGARRLAALDAPDRAAAVYGHLLALEGHANATRLLLLREAIAVGERARDPRVEAWRRERAVLEAPPPPPAQAPAARP